MKLLAALLPRLRTGPCGRALAETPTILHSKTSCGKLYDQPSHHKRIRGRCRVPGRKRGREREAVHMTLYNAVWRAVHQAVYQAVEDPEQSSLQDFLREVHRAAE